LDFYDDGVFSAPKTYGIRKKSEDIIKIKGIDVKTINLEELKEKFYKNDRIVFNEQLNFRKSDYILKQYYIEKEIALFTYNKRIFSKDKKNTKPIFKENI
jgi:hypothetical protein